MGTEQEVQKKIEEYQELIKNDPKVDAAALMMAALVPDKREMLSARKKRWAFLISVGAPPFGLIFAFWFYFSDKADGKRAAMICVGLTVASLFVTWAIVDMMFASFGPDIEKQLQTINVNDVRSLFE